MVRVTEQEFDRSVTRAIKRIPREIRDHLNNIVITVEKRPSKALLKDMGLPPDEPLLGLFQGVSLLERSFMEPPLYPDTIILFQEPIEEMCDSMEELEEEIEVTVVHEVAHYLGMDEERLAELGYD